MSVLGLVHAIHVLDPQTGQTSRELARDWTWAAVKHGDGAGGQSDRPAVHSVSRITVLAEVPRSRSSRLSGAARSRVTGCSGHVQIGPGRPHLGPLEHEPEHDNDNCDDYQDQQV